jgi:hypothetical protein
MKLALRVLFLAAVCLVPAAGCNNAAGTNNAGGQTLPDAPSRNPKTTEKTGFNVPALPPAPP